MKIDQGRNGRSAKVKARDRFSAAEASADIDAVLCEKEGEKHEMAVMIAQRLRYERYVSHLTKEIDEAFRVAEFATASPLDNDDDVLGDGDPTPTDSSFFEPLDDEFGF
jgi:hypothetical protein